MKKLSFTLFGCAVALLAWPGLVQACDVLCQVTVPLIAAQHYDLGQVTVDADTTNVTVGYRVTEPGFCLTETHLYVDPAFPTKTAPGQFAWGDDMLGCVTEWGQDISWNDLGGAIDAVWVAAHAVVCGAGADFDEFALGLTNEMGATSAGRVSTSLVRTGESYWQVTFNDGAELAGETYPGWCVDTSRTIGGTHPMLLIPSFIEDGYGGVMLNPELAIWIDTPENMDLVNWVINQGYVGTESPGEYGVYTFGDVQRAIWALIDDNPNSTAGLGGWNADRVNEILDAAWAFGEGFVPTCGHVVAVVMVDDSGTYQTTIFQVTFFELGLPCVPTSNCETAWGEGEQIRPNKNWAMTFNYDPYCQ